MSFEAACGVALLRAIFVALVAWGFARMGGAVIQTARGWRSTALWGLLWLPFVMPGMFVGYAYNGWTLFLSAADFWRISPWIHVDFIRTHLTTQYWIWNEALLFLLLVARVVPVGVAVACFGPGPTLSPAAAYAWRLTLAREPSWFRRAFGEFRLWIRVNGQAAAPALGVMFLLAFQEFELVARLARPSWTVWLIDAQATGVSLERSAILAIVPALLQLLILVPAALAMRTGIRHSAHSPIPVKLSVSRRLGFGLFLVGALGIVCVAPSVLVGADFAIGVKSLWNQPATRMNLAREITVGLLVSGLATAAVIGVVRWSSRRSANARESIGSATCISEEPPNGRAKLLLSRQCGFVSQYACKGQPSTDGKEKPSLSQPSSGTLEFPSDPDASGESRGLPDGRHNELRESSGGSAGASPSRDVGPADRSSCDVLRGMGRCEGSPTRQYGIKRFAWFLSMIPGLAGALLLSLWLLVAFRFLGFGLATRTVIPWLLAQALLLLPRAGCLAILVRESIDPSACHAARLLTQGTDASRRAAGRNLIWRMAGVKQFAAVWLLWYSAYLDLATGQLLAPPGISSAPVTLYIQMHYGRNAVLSAMTIVTVLVPVLLASGFLLIRPFLARWGSR